MDDKDVIVLEQRIVSLLQQVNKSIARAILLMEFLTGEKLKK